MNRARRELADKAGNIYYARRRINEAFLAELYEEFCENGKTILRRGGQESPSTFLKCLVQLVPRELTIEHSGTIISKLSDEQLGAMVTELERQIATRMTGEGAKVIEAIPEIPETPAHARRVKS